MTAAYTYLMDTGTISIDTADLLDDVETEWTAAFGLALDLDSSTPQGTMIGSETIARTSVMKNNADLANMLNPNLAYSTFLDAICSFLGIERGVDLSTIATNVLLTGNAQTAIQAGSRVQTANGDVLTLVESVLIPVSKSVRAIFQSAVFGPVPIPIGNLTIIDGTVGWGTAAIDATTIVGLGSNAYTDPQLKNARSQQLAKQGTGSAQAIYAAVMQVPNVTSCMVVENNTGAAGAINGVTLTLPNAMWVCVAGTPANTLVAQALYNAHGGGCPWDYGTASGTPVNPAAGVTAYDPSTQLPYQVKWTTPVLYDTYINITIHQTPSQSPGADAIANAILAFAQGQEQGEAGFVVGADVSSWEVAGSVARQFPGVYVKTCQVACVLAGAAAPVFPAGYVYEFIIPQFGQAQLAVGNIKVNLV